jgi:hypothetical protein
MTVKAWRAGLSRRRLLRGAGALGLGAAGLLGALESRIASAQAGSAPKRLLILFMPNCNQQHFWVAEGGLAPETGAGNASQFTLGSGYRALEAVRDELTLIQGMNLDVKGKDAHSAAVIRFMTGGGVTDGTFVDPMGEWAVLPSIDQLLLAGAPSLQGTRFPSLDLIADDRQETSNPIYVVLSWGKDLRPRFSAARPHQVYDRLFVGADLQGQDLTEQLANEQSVLDVLKTDLAELSRRVPSSERPQLESHLAGIRELETSLQAVLGGAAELPARPPELDQADSKNHRGIIDAHFQLARSALQLDLTRVVTLAFASSNNFADFGTIIGGSQFTDNITYPFASFGVHALAHRDESTKSATLEIITDWYMQRTVELIKLLATTPDTDGSRLLDNTLVVLFSETGEGHAHDNIPLALFGGKTLGILGNRCLRYGGRMPHDLWTALAPLYGLDLPVFGDPEQNRGPLPGIRV